MSDEEKKPSSSIIKYLLIAIAFLATMVLSAVVSIMTYRIVMEPKEDAPEEVEQVVKDNVDIDEIIAYTLNEKDPPEVPGEPKSDKPKPKLIEKGLIKYKINVEVNDTKVKEYLTAKASQVNDVITRYTMKYLVADIIKQYKDGKLHNDIKVEINKIIGNNIKVEKTMLGGGKKKSFLAVRVNIKGFSAMVLE